jgi:hypothetical protein
MIPAMPRGAVRRRTWARAVLCACTVVAVLVATAVPAFAQADPSKSGDLTGNFDWIVWLLIPLATILGIVTAAVLGHGGDPSTSARRAGGVSRALSRAESSGSQPPA